MRVIGDEEGKVHEEKDEKRLLLSALKTKMKIASNSHEGGYKGISGEDPERRENEK